MKLLLAPVAVTTLLGSLVAQAEPPNGPRQVDPRWHAFRGATVVTSPGQQIENATLVIRDGVIVSVEAGGAAPDGARVWDVTGRFVYPGLIEPYLPVESPMPDGQGQATHWNDNVRPERSALDGAGATGKVREELRGLGFAAAAVVPTGGIFTGRGAVVLLSDAGATEGVRYAPVVRRDVFHGVTFDGRGEGYPRSLMGCVALIRQTLLDADHHAHAHEVYARNPTFEPPQVNAALATLGVGGAGSPPLLFAVGNELEELTALQIAREFERPAIVLGNGTEYRRLSSLASAGARLLLTVDFPDAPDVDSLADAEAVSLRDLMAWEQAPTNPRRVVAAGLTAALTTHRLDARKEFPDKVREAIRHGLSADDALAMLTTRPASMLGASEQLGEIAPGKLANLVICDGPLFEEDTRLLDVWVRGQRHVQHDPDEHRLEGNWNVSAVDAPFSGTLKIGKKNKVTLEVGEKKLNGRKAAVARDAVDFLVDGDELERPGAFALRGVAHGAELVGTGRGPDGAAFTWTATRTGEASEDEESKDEPEEPPLVPEFFPTPLGAFGLLEPPRQRTLLLENATLWVSGAGLQTRRGSLLVQNGKIQWVGPADVRPDFEDLEVIDCTGKHVTPGLIDCHSHTGINGGVNEGTQAVTAEVRIADALDPDDVNWYRQLAGGVTMVQQLHGSANPIGGQSNVVKLRWGVEDPQEMRMRGGKLNIKFALGENVKRSGRRGEGPTRYPSSRMGVEALIRDRFTAAAEYSKEWHEYLRVPIAERERRVRPRRDLELDALAEILSGLRLVHCHSYRQDEILMLCRVAKDFGFKIGAFQHGLEGYKVAEAIKENAIGASVFSDWWAYKFEVFDAIPYNGAIMHRVGVTVSFNSDSNELARRLNTEAAKAVKYGDLRPGEAMLFVTMAPATQLGLEDRVGSLVIGKEADFVIWSGDPLSPFSKCEATYIDGREYFSLEKDQALRQFAAAERQRLLQKLRSEQQKDKKRGRDRDGANGDRETPRFDEWIEHSGDERGVCGCSEEVGR